MEIKSIAKRSWKRIEFVDFLRGIAVVLMVMYHFFFDLAYFGKIRIESEIFWFWLPRFIGGLFIFVSGISLTLARIKYGNKLTRVYLRKGAKYFLLGLLISILTLPTGCYVRFGILHFFGVSVILASFFASLKYLAAFLGVTLIFAGIKLDEIHVNSESLLWIGIKPVNFCTLDYYPLLPWLGIMLMGIFAGNSFNFNLKVPRFFKPITYVGRKSLTIYLLQHPLIIAVMQAYYGDVIQQILSTVFSWKNKHFNFCIF